MTGQKRVDFQLGWRPRVALNVQFPPDRDGQALLAFRPFLKADLQLSAGKADGPETPDSVEKLALAVEASV
ncbi:hypothetical protein [Sphingomonas sp. PAMC 26621]|uniref:hypothetical protein n=1 Tax=Sphingomonas sp. PAMC 26621 TaxID=1112213 RepID=UPI001478DB7B|nr:hypothetical protein [Sphingomonas sp. PAMC 26621]